MIVIDMTAAVVHFFTVMPGFIADVVNVWRIHLRKLGSLSG